jgi:hypothetical protein
VLTRRPDTIPRRNSSKARIAICVRIMEGARPKNHCCLYPVGKANAEPYWMEVQSCQRNRGWGRARK